MNFQELMQRMVVLDQPISEEKKADKDYDKDGEVESEKDEVMGSRMAAAKKAGKMDEADEPPRDSTTSAMGSAEKEKELDEAFIQECGMPMPGGMMGDRQPDSVSMNVSINASGGGGIRDLMGILRSIESGGDDGAVAIVDEPPVERGIEMDEFKNEPDEMYGDVDSVINQPGTGDLNKPKQMYKHSYRQGDNPMTIHVHEQLVDRLGKLYQTIKESK